MRALSTWREVRDEPNRKMSASALAITWLAKPPVSPVSVRSNSTRNPQPATRSIRTAPKTKAISVMAIRRFIGSSVIRIGSR